MASKGFLTTIRLLKPQRRTFLTCAVHFLKFSPIKYDRGERQDEKYDDYDRKLYNRNLARKKEDTELGTYTAPQKSLTTCLCMLLNYPKYWRCGWGRGGFQKNSKITKTSPKMS